MARRRGQPVYRSRHVTVWFDMDRKGIAACAVGPELAAACMSVIVNRAMPYAISISPTSDRRHAHYAAGFVAVPVLTGLAPESIGRPPMLRAGARLINTVRHAAAVEWGNHATGGIGQHILGRTLDHLNSARLG